MDGAPIPPAAVRATPANEQQAAGVGILLQIMMLVLSFVLGHILRRHKVYYLPEASASLLIVQSCLVQCCSGKDNVAFITSNDSLKRLLLVVWSSLSGNYFYLSLIVSVIVFFFSSTYIWKSNTRSFLLIFFGI